MTLTQPRPPVPPFSYDDAVQKVRMAENAWNGCDPAKVAQAYTPDTAWRNRSQFLQGRAQVEAFLTEKWATENGYRLIKKIWAHSDDKIAVRFCYEYHDASGQWFRAHGNENWAFDPDGYMAQRHASINDVPISEGERLFHWDAPGPRPEDHPGLTALGL
jgi:nuclear transport factor 2 (NTF2) superfamily protein